MGSNRHFRVWRGDDTGGQLEDFDVEVNDGEVVLDIIHRLQATQTPDLAVRWNCKAGKCGSCSMEINGMPKLGCMTRMSTFEETETVTVTPLRTFPVIRDLVTDVSFNYQKAREMPAFAPPKGVEPGDRVAIKLEPSRAFYAAVFGAMKAGAIAVPLFTLFGPDGVKLRVEDCKPKLLIEDDGFLGELAARRKPELH